MRNSLPRLTPKRCLKLAFLVAQILLLIGITGGSTTLQAATTRPPTLLSGPTSTRAIAFESVSMKAEPFPVTASVAFSTDTRTRIAIFAMNLDFLGAYGLGAAPEATTALTADAQDSAGKVYSLRIEHVGQVPGFPGITMIIVRLADDMGDVGDVLLNLNLHGTSSNRVRVAIGHMGGGPPDDIGAVATPAPVTPPPPDVPLVPETYLGPASSDADTVRFLEQASWGPTAAEVTRVRAMGFRAYLDEQFNLPPLNVPKGSNFPDMAFLVDDQGTACPATMPTDPTYVQADCNRDNFSMYQIHRNYYTNALYGPDQLRQRVAWALHQILVVSGRDITVPSRLTVYLQALDRGAFGNYRTLLNEITLNPAMGEYLDMRLSRRTDPNENFAREILQLFSIGTVELNLDGTSKLDAQGSPIASYNQTTVNEFTRVFTGWNFAAVIAAGTTNFRDPMIPRGGTNHDFNPKTLLNGLVTPQCAGTSGAVNVACAQADMTIALDNIFNHPNVGPFVGKQMIQHLVTSNPTPPYVARVARVFNNDCDALYPQGCTGVRGNMRAVVQAILLDPEARGDVKTDPNFGKLREPAQYVNNILRANNVKSFDRTTTSDGVLGSRSSSDFTNTLDQGIFLPPTVFSYFQPGYEIPGLKILGPAFGILSTSTTLRRANAVNTLVYSGVNVTTAPNTDRPRGTSLDLTNLETIANADPGGVADQLNALMLHGTMSTQMRTSLVTAMSAINDADTALRARKRARTAVYLVATSSQFDIQR